MQTASAGFGRRGRGHRRRLLWAIAALALAGGVVLLIAMRPRWLKAAHEVELMRRGLQRQAAHPSRKPAAPHEAQLVLSAIRVARGITPDGKPRDPTGTLSPRDRTVYIFFEYAGAPEGASLTSDWFLNGTYQDLNAVPVRLPAGAGRGHLELSLEGTQTLPAGAYRVDLIFQDTVLDSAEFTVP